MTGTPERPVLHRLAEEVESELPGLRLYSLPVSARPGPSNDGLRRQLRGLSDRVSGPQAIALRRQPIPHAYRVFFRHIGIEPDERRVPVEALALERMRHGGFRSRGALDDAITIAVMDTSVPVWALDDATLEGGLRLRESAHGEPLGRGEEAATLPAGRLVVADDRGPVAELFGDPVAAHGVTRRTTRIALFSVAVPGVPAISAEEALWTVWDTLAG